MFRCLPGKLFRRGPTHQKGFEGGLYVAGQEVVPVDVAEEGVRLGEDSQRSKGFNGHEKAFLRPLRNAL